ncbi:MAG TPA: oxidoreductase family protein [Dehalococcoidia bacterium]|nr:oxidoreductase family protein [Dehalococcoidia bacterium]
MGATDYPTDPGQVTPEWLTHALRQSGAINEASVTSHTAKVIGEGAGFMGQLAHIALDYDRQETDAPRSVIAKFPAAAQENRDVAMYFHFYEREVGFYQHIGGNVSLRTPRCYYNAFDPSNGDFVLLLEDLAPAAVGDQVGGCTVDQVDLAIRELARFQATWWRSPELDKLDWMPGIHAEWNVAAVEQNYPLSWEPFLDFTKAYLTPTVREAGERFGKQIRTLMNHFGDDLPVTIVHGDYRLDNMFFGKAGSGTEFAVIDWQISSRGGGVFDVAYFVAGSLTPDERRARERDIVKLYHDTLVSHGVQGYTLDQCWEDYRLSTLFLLAYSVIGAGGLDLANERGVDLFTKITSRTIAAIDDLKAYELLDQDRADARGRATRP